MLATPIAAAAPTGQNVPPGTTATATVAKGSVKVTVTNLRNEKGIVMACMTRASAQFPRCADDGTSYRITLPPSDRTVLTFHDVTPGRYAIALLHDENNNGKADSAMMIPTEGFGFSRDAKVRMGPPKFRDAAFDVGPGKAAQTIRMRYML